MPKRRTTEQKPQSKPFIKYLQPKTANQALYIRTIVENDVTFAIGPAGSGKTAVAVGLACQYFLENRVDKIIITRPVLESGEKLGALPGEMAEKMKPYLIPIYDEFHKYMSHSELVQWTNETVGGIEIAPLAYMRGRTFHKAFIILDEGQNCSMKQIKMFLTRIGQDSKMIVTGDVDQTDLPDWQAGALQECVDKLEGLEGIGIVRLEPSDIVRNKMIGRILQNLK